MRISASSIDLYGVPRSLARGNDDNAELAFSTPVHEDSKPMLRTHDMLPDEEGPSGDHQ